MKTISNILAVFFLIACAANISFASEAVKADAPSGADYLVDALRYRAEGDCREAIKSYQIARKLSQFKEDWIYHLAVADCLTALKQLDDAIKSYTKVIDATSNRTLQGEMYRGRGFAYYSKAVTPDSLDKHLLSMAKKDLDRARDLGVDVSDLTKNMKDDLEIKHDAPEGKGKAVTSVTARPVTVMESGNKMIVGDGEYVLYISGETKIKDEKDSDVPASAIKPGDIIDFSYTQSYRNKADGMVHLSADTVTLKREVLPEPQPQPAPQEMKEKQQPAQDAAEMLLLSKINMLADEIKELRAKLEAKEASRQKAKKRPRRKSPAPKKAAPEKNELEGEIK